MLDSCTRPELITEITCSRCAGMTWTRPSCSATSWYRCVRGHRCRHQGRDRAGDRHSRADFSGPHAAARPGSAGRALLTEAVRSLVAELAECPLIGFAGGPFTLASYLVEGGPSKNHDKTKALMYGDPALWHALLGRLADITILVPPDPGRGGCFGCPALRFLGRRGQPGRLPARDPSAYQPDLRGARAVRRAAHSLRGRNRRAARAGWVRPVRTWSGSTGASLSTKPSGGSIRGKLCKATLTRRSCLAPWEVIEERAKDVIARGRAAEGHVFNLGHGVLPETDPAMLARLADLVHVESARTPA